MSLFWFQSLIWKPPHHHKCTSTPHSNTHNKTTSYPHRSTLGLRLPPLLPPHRIAVLTWNGRIMISSQSVSWRSNHLASAAADAAAGQMNDTEAVTRKTPQWLRYLAFFLSISTAFGLGFYFFEGKIGKCVLDYFQSHQQGCRTVQHKVVVRQSECSPDTDSKNPKLTAPIPVLSVMSVLIFWAVVLYRHALLNIELKPNGASVFQKQVFIAALSKYLVCMMNFGEY